jgi:hypothetical protein
MCPMTQKSFNFVKEWGKYCKMFSDKYVLNYGQFYPIAIHKVGTIH